MGRTEDTAQAEIAAGESQIRQGLIANNADQTRLETAPTQADVLAVVRRMLNRERQIMIALRALARYMD